MSILLNIFKPHSDSVKDFAENNDLTIDTTNEDQVVNFTQKFIKEIKNKKINYSELEKYRSSFHKLENSTQEVRSTSQKANSKLNELGSLIEKKEGTIRSEYEASLLPHLQVLINELKHPGKATDTEIARAEDSYQNYKDEYITKFQSGEIPVSYMIGHKLDELNELIETKKNYDENVDFRIEQLSLLQPLDPAILRSAQSVFNILDGNPLSKDMEAKKNKLGSLLKLRAENPGLFE